MHSQFWRFWTQIEIHQVRPVTSGVFIDVGRHRYWETAIVEKARYALRVTLGAGKMSANAIQRS